MGNRIVISTMADYISVSEALKLLSPFKGEKERYWHLFPM